MKKISTLICLITTILSVKCNVTPSDESGLLLFHERTILLKAGTHHIEIMTNLNPSEDIHKIEKLQEMFEVQCMTAMRDLKYIQCADKRDEIAHAGAIAIDVISRSLPSEISKKNKRTRRSTKRGFIPFIWDLLFGSNEHDEESFPSGSAGAIKHSIEVFKNIDQQIKIKEKTIDLEITKLTEDINKENQRMFTSIDSNAINAQLAAVKGNIIDNFNILSNAYSLLTHSSLPALIHHLQPKINELEIPFPELDANELLKVSTLHKTLLNDCIVLQVGIVIVRNDTFHKLLVIPTPDITTKEIADIVPSTIIINNEKSEYLENIEEVEINETLSITKSSLQIRRKIDATSRCIYKSLNAHKNMCKYKKLPELYDEWFITPLHNTLAFYSTEKNFLVCPGTRTLITAKAGTIEVPSKCFVETPTKKMESSDDRISVKKFSFFIGTGQLPPILQTNSSHENITSYTSFEINTSALDTLSLDWETISPFNIVMITVVVMLALLLLGTTSYIICMAKKKTDTPIDPDSHPY